MSTSHEWGEVDAFTAGAVGPPGQRVFFLQARAHGMVVTVRCEKQQVLALAEYLTGQLAEHPGPAADEARAGHPSVLELADPIVPEWVVGPMGVAYDQETERFVLALEEIVELDEEGEPLPEALADRGVVRVLLTRAQAGAFCQRAAELAAGGRPPCRWCGRPLDPTGHACPRMN